MKLFRRRKTQELHDEIADLRKEIVMMYGEVAGINSSSTRNRNLLSEIEESLKKLISDNDVKMKIFINDEFEKLRKNACKTEKKTTKKGVEKPYVFRGIRRNGIIVSIDDRLMTAGQVAKLLNVHINSIDYHFEGLDLTVMKPTKYRFFLKEEIMAYKRKNNL